MKNTLVIVGFLGDFTAYLNVPRDEAVARYLESTQYAGYDVRTFEFDDEFNVYDASSNE